MKRKPLYGVLGLFILFSLFETSCSKTGVNEPGMQHQSVFSVSEARAWLTKAGASNSNLSGKSGIQTAILNPDWEHAVAKDDANYQSLEIPATFKSRVFLSASAANAASSSKNISKYLILKDKKTGNLSSVLMSATSEQNIDATNFHYAQVPSGFSGKVLYTNTETAALINGWVYKDGKITGTITAGKNVQAAEPSCTDTEYGVYATTCYYTSGGTLLYCGDPELLYTYTVTICTGGGDGGIGTNPPPPPNNCAVEANNFLYAGESMSGTTNESTVYNNGSEWKLVYNWKIFSAGTWGLISYEKALLNKVYYPDNISRWEFSSFEHDKIVSMGINVGGTRTFADLGATVNMTSTHQSAWVRVDFSTTSSVVCPGVSPLVQVWNSNKTFYAP